MKKIFTILTFLTATSIFATDRYVDPNLSSGNGTTLFTNITSAVAAAVNGDRIIVSSNTYNEATLTISKSLKIIPQTAGTTINFNANIIIAGFPGMKLEILGFNLGIYSFGSSPIVSGSYTNRAKITIIDCITTNIDLNNEYYESNVIKNTIVGNLTFKFGYIVSNSMQSCFLWDENGENQDVLKKILIVNNTISGSLLLFNNDYKYYVTNNILNTLILKRWNSSNLIKNKIINNDFVNNSQINISYVNVPNYNIVFSSNNFLGNFSLLSNNNCAGAGCAYYTQIGDYNSVELGIMNCCGSLYSNSTSLFPNTGVTGFFEWTYNGNNPIDINTDANSPLVLTKIIGSNIVIDGGNPNHDFYDIDLTINDRGRIGGPYSTYNYNATSNPNNSKAFIFDLDIPTDLFPGQNVNISAKGYHKN